MTPDEQNWLTWGAIRHRPHGSTRWQEAGTRAAIAKHCGTWGLAEATVHVLAHARDPKANTPNVIASRFAPDNEPEIGGHPHPPRREQECRKHPGNWANPCSGCAADMAPDPDYGQPSQLTHDPTPPRVPPPGDVIDEDTGRKITGRELFDIKRQELDLRNALTPSIEEEA